MERATEYVDQNNVLKTSQSEENPSLGTRFAQKTAFTSTFGASSSFRVSRTRQSKIFRPKNSQSYVPQKKESPNKKDKNWRLRFYQSLQVFHCIFILQAPTPPPLAHPPKKINM